MSYHAQGCSCQGALDNIRANIKRTYRLEEKEKGVNIWFWEREVCETKAYLLSVHDYFVILA